MRNVFGTLTMVLVGISFLIITANCGDDSDDPRDAVLGDDLSEGDDDADLADILDDSQEEGDDYAKRYGYDQSPRSIADFKWPVVNGQKLLITAGYGPNGGSPYHRNDEYYALDVVNGDSPKDTRWMWVVNPAYGKVKRMRRRNERLDNRGNYVIIDHGNGFESRFYHLQEDPTSCIHEGDILLAGTFLGYTGSTGSATGPHIHFVILKNGTSIPMNGIDGDQTLRVGGVYTSSNTYVRPPHCIP